MKRRTMKKRREEQKKKTGLFKFLVGLGITQWITRAHTHHPSFTLHTTPTLHNCTAQTPHNTTQHYTTL
jgi:hypothetical protein